MCFLYQSKCGWEDEEGGAGAGWGPRREAPTCQQQAHLHKQPSHGEASGKTLLRDLQLRESWAALRGQSWPAVGGGGMKGKAMEKGGRARGEGGGGPEQFNGALI